MQRSMLVFIYLEENMFEFTHCPDFEEKAEDHTSV